VNDLHTFYDVETYHGTFSSLRHVRRYLITEVIRRYIMPWNPDAYNQFYKDRSAPFTDLMALIECREGLEVIDLGCGTGQLTRRLADSLPESNVLGIDSSAEMLARTAEYTRPGLRFEQQRLEDVQGEWDLVFSHAVIQWVPDHRQLIPQLLSMVRPGGQIAVHIPSNHTHYSHRAILETVAEEPFCTALANWRRISPVLPADQYAELLFENGAGNITAFEKVYPVMVENTDEMVKWTKSTTLIPYFERLPEALHGLFMDRYCAKLRARWADGPIFYTYRRTLFVATKALS
jgi:trans-aconitate 2-methyltransferase